MFFNMFFSIILSSYCINKNQCNKLDFDYDKDIVMVKNMVAQYLFDEKEYLISKNDVRQSMRRKKT